MANFINFSNHPSDKWSDEQKFCALEYGEIIDVPFPEVDPSFSEQDISELGDKYIAIIKKENPCVVLCQGEYTLTYYVVQKLEECGIRCVSACSRRVTSESVDEKGVTIKKALFQFERFRFFIQKEK